MKEETKNIIESIGKTTLYSNQERGSSDAGTVVAEQLTHHSIRHRSILQTYMSQIRIMIKRNTIIQVLNQFNLSYGFGDRRWYKRLVHR
jgi:hypothetical protein